jgi:hypothetical protein
MKVKTLCAAASVGAFGAEWLDKAEMRVLEEGLENSRCAVRILPHGGAI